MKEICHGTKIFKKYFQGVVYIHIFYKQKNYRGEKAFVNLIYFFFYLLPNFDKTITGHNFYTWIYDLIHNEQ